LKNVVLEDGPYRWELDCYWPDHGLVVELDGRPYHIAVRDMEKDKFKDGKLLRKGIQTLRVTDFRMEYDTPGVLDDVRAVLSLRRRRAGL
jgi:very-short-patch-repair endonuclease